MVAGALGSFFWCRTFFTEPTLWVLPTHFGFIVWPNIGHEVIRNGCPEIPLSDESKAGEYIVICNDPPRFVNNEEPTDE